MYTGFVQNFANLSAVGVIIIAKVGVVVLEEFRLMKALFRKLVIIAPPSRSPARLHRPFAAANVRVAVQRRNRHDES